MSRAGRSGSSRVELVLLALLIILLFAVVLTADDRTAFKPDWNIATDGPEDPCSIWNRPQALRATD